MNSVTISIIIPVFNTDFAKLNRCVNSILNQTVSPHEIIIVDDGSKEECANYCDEIAAKHPIIKVFHKKNEGSAVARNTGLDAASGEYIMFVDSDDFVTEYMLYECIEVIKRNNRPDVVLGLVTKSTDDTFSQIITEDIINQKEINLINTEFEKHQFVNHLLGYEYRKYEFEQGYFGDCPYSRAVKKEITPHFSEESMWNDDTIWNLYLFSKCKTIAYINSVWYVYLIFCESKTRKYRNNCANEFRFRTNQEMNLVKELLPDCNKGISIRIWRDTIILGRTYLYHSDNKASFIKRFGEYKKLIKIDSYKYMLDNISFDYETARGNRFAKRILRLCMKYGFNICSFLIWKKICNDIR